MYYADYVLFIFIVSVLSIAAIFDIKNREVPDFVSYLLIGGSFMLSLLYTIYTSSLANIEFMPVSVGILFGFAFLMYISGQWGGGDAKLMLGLGMAFTSISLSSRTSMFAVFINILLFGGIYGIFSTLVAGVLNIKKLSKYTKRYDIILIVAGAVIILSAFMLLPYPLSWLIAFSLFMLVSMRFIYLISNNLMYVETKTEKLEEGDWLAEEVKDSHGKTLLQPRNIGLLKDDITKLKENNVKTVLIKIGMPFVPSILLGVLVTIIFGNPLLSVLSAL
ncbi:A24 family peptidase [Candidatus Parvarchaeota archaeon]|nr:A24 family peptidase [Candidatus Parvarchaeota archaeon]